MKYRIEWRYRWAWLTFDELYRWRYRTLPKWVTGCSSMNLKDEYETQEEAIADLLLYLNDPYWEDEMGFDQFELLKFAVRIKNEISN